jgi:hypothetical protein
MFSVSKIPEPRFNRKKVNSLILKVQKSKDEEIVSAAKFELFKMMKKIIVKNVTNCQMLFRNSSVTSECPESWEIESECYIILDKCAYNYKVSGTSCFYFYYNKSLTRSLFRMFSKEVRVFEKFQAFSKSEVTRSVINNSTQYDIDFLLSFLDLSSVDVKVLKSKLRNEKKDEFLKKRKFISNAQYQNSIKKIKQEIEIFKDDKY